MWHPLMYHYSTMELKYFTLNPYDCLFLELCLLNHINLVTELAQNFYVGGMSFVALFHVFEDIKCQ